ncbi:zinc finger CCCH domain-containing protein 44 isoform X1 [Spatholobus suberectus]|nr:zinc finger CCCH domain-containing protein 44 isoform X1 [Spatholobus suberectus]
MDQKLKLEVPSEQSRLLNDIPKVIPDIIDTNLSPEGSPRKDKLEQNGLSELASGKTCNSVGCYCKHSGFAHCLNNRTDVAGPKSPVKENQDGTAFPVASVEQLSVNISSQDKGTSQRKLPQSTSKARQDDPEATLFEELSNPANSVLCQSGSGINGRNLSTTRYAKQTIKEKQSISLADPVKVSVDDKQDTSISAIPVEEKQFCISTTDVIVLSDDDEQEANVADILAGRKAGGES